MIDEENIPVIAPVKQIGSGLAGPGRPKGSKGKPRGRYVTVASLLDTIQDTLGCSYQEAVADMLFSERAKYEAGQDNFGNYPKILMQISNKVVEQARNMPEETPSDISELTDEELKEKQRQAVIEYIKVHGVPNVE